MPPTIEDVRNLAGQIEEALASGDPKRIQWAIEVQQKGGCNYDGPPTGESEEQYEARMARRQANKVGKR
ncbi:MAG: hypothetical protein WC686_05025 [Candidatus Shapirobacteria bacterium]